MNNQDQEAQKTSKKRGKSTKSKDTHRIVKHYELLDGAVKIIRTTKSGQFWSMSCWLKDEGKCYRRSLRTKNTEEAKELARDQFFKLQGDIRAGKIRRLGLYLMDTSNKVLEKHNGNAKAALEEIHKQYEELLKKQNIEYSSEAICFFLVDQLIKCNVFPNMADSDA